MPAMTLKKSLMAAGFLFVLFVVATAATIRPDPLGIFPPPEESLKETRTVLEPLDGRYMEHVTLYGDGPGTIGFTVNLPAASPSGKLPLLIVLGGLETGENNIRYIKYAGDNAIIGYDWPMPLHFPAGKDLLLQSPGLYRRLLTIPGQVASMIVWLRRQPWADATRVSLLGYSLGALALPVVERFVERNGHSIGWTIIAYGGAPFGSLLSGSDYIKPAWLQNVLVPVIDAALTPFQPAVHLPHLKSRFLVLEGKEDEFVPEEARRNLREAVPEPKTVVVFEGTHIGVGAKHLDLLQRIIETSRSWLIENGAVNPP
jgi:surfactin synthase thioesterase subunit